METVRTQISIIRSKTKLSLPAYQYVEPTGIFTTHFHRTCSHNFQSSVAQLFSGSFSQKQYLHA